MRARTKRLWALGAGVLVLGGAAVLTATAVQDSAAYFYAPSSPELDIAKTAKRARLGGLVAEGSIQRGEDGRISFAVTDGAASVPVRYQGVTPDLFGEGEGALVEGRFGADGVFEADRIIAKHDETYVPKEVQKALEEAGQWRGRPARESSAP